MYTVYMLEGAIWKVGSLFVACKGQKSNYGSLNSSKKQTKLTILSKEDDQDSGPFILRPHFWKNVEKWF